MPQPKIDLGFATSDDVAAVAAVIQEAARWIATWRSELWDPALVGEAFVAPHVAQGQMLTARTGGEIAGVMIMLTKDLLFWPDDPPGEAVYLHKLAVRRAYSGLGLPATLMDYAEKLARAQDRHVLRLDCDPPLTAFYERLDFRQVDEIDADHPEAGPMRVARMERRAAA